MAGTASNQEKKGDCVFSGTEAFAGIVFAAIAADGTISETELQRQRHVLSRMRLFRGCSNAEYDAMFAKIKHVFQTQGINSLIESSIHALDPKLYRTAFAVAVDIVLADGSVHGDEKDFLYELQQKLNIEDELATRIIEVIIIKNQG